MGLTLVNKAAGTLNHKYITEDVPTGLIPISELGLATAYADAGDRYSDRDGKADDGTDVCE